jgi:hypothetical protein
VNKQTQAGGNYTKQIIISISILILMVVGFFGGVQYQKGHQPKHPTSATGQGSPFGQGGSGGPGGGFSGQRPTIGSVTAVSASSITVNDQTSGSSKTFSITSSTTISNNGQTATANDISVGTTVVVIADSSSSTQASRILVNPSTGGNAPSTTSN